MHRICRLRQIASAALSPRAEYQIVCLYSLAGVASYDEGMISRLHLAVCQVHLERTASECRQSASDVASILTLCTPVVPANGYVPSDYLLSLGT